MAFEIIHGDLVRMEVDAIVNSANPRPIYQEGLDEQIHRAAGAELLQARQAIGHIAPGSCAITNGYALKAKYVIHGVGPVWMGGFFGEARLLRRCYVSALRLALEHDCKSIAFPLIGVNHYGFPKEKALAIVTEVVKAFLEEHDMRVILVLPSREMLALSEELLEDVQRFLRLHYREDLPRPVPPAQFNSRMRSDAKYTVLASETDFDYAPSASAEPEVCMAPAPAKKSTLKSSRPAPQEQKYTLDELLAKTDAGFSETLLKLIDQSGKKDSAIYTRANVSRQHFSKIRNNPAYKPTKTTAIAFAIALELDLEQTKDLIGRAGYALTNSSKFDVIITYFIQERNYNIFDINAALFRFDQSLLGV